MTDYNVKIIKDSINPVKDRIITFELTYPRFVHAELMTHRMLSRNSASSRAIPTKKLMARVRDFPVMPKWWGKNQSGMQAREELQGEELENVKLLWLDGSRRALHLAQQLHEAGLHKQIANRVIEPWMFITVIVTATEYENWFYLRDSEFAQPEIAWVAREMSRLRDESEPEELSPGQWHLPYIELENRDNNLFVENKDLSQEMFGAFLRKISTARCARVSYLTHDGRRDYDEDIKLHDKLVQSGHWSPFEHVAESLHKSERHGNFIGWFQYRKQFLIEHHGRRLP